MSTPMTTPITTITAMSQPMYFGFTAEQMLFFVSTILIGQFVYIGYSFSQKVIKRVSRTLDTIDDTAHYIGNIKNSLVGLENTTDKMMSKYTFYNAMKSITSICKMISNEVVYPRFNNMDMNKCNNTHHVIHRDIHHDMHRDMHCSDDSSSTTSDFSMHSKSCPIPMQEKTPEANTSSTSSTSATTSASSTSTSSSALDKIIDTVLNAVSSQQPNITATVQKVMQEKSDKDKNDKDKNKCEKEKKEENEKKEDSEKDTVVINKQDIAQEVKPTTSNSK
jgi:hypothetical protein